MLQLTSISSPALRGTRRVWVEEGVNDGHCRIFLDAELYIERVKTAEIVRELVPMITCVYLSSGEAIDRHTDFACNEEFASFLAYDLAKWIDQYTGRSNEFELCGLSLSGLAAAHAAITYPQVFPRILCQSPSAWWNDEWLAKHIDGKNLSKIKCWLSVGDRETDENVTHEPTGMVQKTSQVSSCRRLTQAISKAGATVKHNLYEGGHDPVCWSAELPSALRWLSTPK